MLRALIHVAEFKWVWSFIKKYKYRFCSALVLVVIVNVMNMANPLIQGQIVDRVITGGQTEILLKLAITMIAITVLKSVI